MERRRIRVQRNDENRHGFHVWWRTLQPMQGPHVHEQIEVMVLEQGWIKHSQCGVDRELQPGSLIAFWSAFPHWTVETSPDAACTLLYLPVDWFLGHPAAVGLMSYWMERRMIADANPQHLAWIQQCLKDYAQDDPVSRHILRLDIEAYLLRLGRNLGVVGPTVAPASGERENHRQGVAAMIDTILKRYNEPLSVADIANAASVHPHYAMGIFRRTVGLTIWEFLLQVRTAHAQRLLADSRLSVLEAGLGAGFGSCARFYATFRRLTGTTPEKYRRELVH